MSPASVNVFMFFYSPEWRPLLLQTVKNFLPWCSGTSAPLSRRETPPHLGHDGGQTQEAEPQGVTAPAPSPAHQPTQALRPASQQERHLLSRPAAASLPEEPRQVQEVDRGAGAAQRGVHSGCRRSAKDHQVRVCPVWEMSNKFYN